MTLAEYDVAGDAETATALAAMGYPGQYVEEDGGRPRLVVRLDRRGVRWLAEHLLRRLSHHPTATRALAGNLEVLMRFGEEPR